MTAERIEARLSIIISIFLLCAAWYQGQIARQTLIDSLRPFLYVPGVHIVGGGPDGKGQYVIKINITNSGQTQARKMITTDGLGTVQGFPPPEWEPPTDFDFKEVAKTFFDLVPPKEYAQVFIPIDTGFVSAIKAHTKTVIVYGTIRYCDIFKSVHMTRFCQKFEFWTLDAKHENQETFLFGPCGAAHSCDDNNCPDYDSHDNGACL